MDNFLNLLVVTSNIDSLLYLSMITLIIVV